MKYITTFYVLGNDGIPGKQMKTAYMAVNKKFKRVKSCCVSERMEGTMSGSFMMAFKNNIWLLCDAFHQQISNASQTGSLAFPLFRIKGKVMQRGAIRWPGAEPRKEAMCPESGFTLLVSSSSPLTVALTTGNLSRGAVQVWQSNYYLHMRTIQADW